VKERTEHKPRIVSDDDLRREMREFEAKYRMSTDEFYSKYNAGEFGHEGFDRDSDFMWWAAIHEFLGKKTARAVNLGR